MMQLIVFPRTLNVQTAFEVALQSSTFQLQEMDQSLQNLTPISEELIQSPCSYVNYRDA